MCILANWIEVFINESYRSKIVVSNMLQLPNDIRIQIVSEGIEDHVRIISLSELDCDLIQSTIRYLDG